MITSALLERRREAAVASGGTSAPAIYRAALDLVLDAGLRGELLEFGAGTGTLVRQLLDAGFGGRITAVDILPRPAGLAAAVRWIQADLHEPLAVAGESFDAIVSTEVIEHLENPRAVFREFGRLLRPGGTLIVTTPNQESLRSLTALALRGHFVDFLDGSYPAHITALVRRDFQRLCQEAGFEPPRFSYTNHGGVPRLPRLRWQTVSAGLLRGRLFSDNVLMLARKVREAR
ncbi:MAG: methyltransferase domain-containing protein [Gemmatimonadetes bacterium]|nr:methyltransferase domain-containing protein [Gemmatimonadota bacterium]